MLRMTMLKRLVGAFAFAGLLVLGAAPAKAVTLTFEEFIGFDQTPIGTFYSGITFISGSSGSDWVARDAGSNNYNVSSFPSGTVYNSGDYWIFGQVFATTALDFTGNDGRISFDNADATFVELAYSALNTFYLEAYSASNVLLDSASGAPNLRYTNSNSGGPGTLHVDWNGTDHIAYVIVHDTGNFWLVDNVTTDATGISVNVPEPSAIWLVTAGLGILGLIRRRWA